MKSHMWWLLDTLPIIEWYIDGLVQDCSNSIAKALELLQPCTKPSISCTVEQFQHCEKCYCIALISCSVEMSTVATDSVFNIDRINNVRIALEKLLPPRNEVSHAMISREEQFLCHNYVKKYRPGFFSRMIWMYAIPNLSQYLHTQIQIQYMCNSTVTNILQRLLPSSKHVLKVTSFSTFRPRQDGRHLKGDIFKCIFINGNFWILTTISLKYVP